MALLSSTLLLRAHSLTILFLSYLLLTNPLSLLSSSPIWLLGESMRMAPASFALTPSLTASVSASTHELLALLALVLGTAATAQFLFAGDLALPGGRSEEGEGDDNARMGEKVYALRAAQTRWLDVLGLRILGMGALVGAVYVLYSGKTTLEGGVLRLLANRVVFTAAMSDMLVCGYLWTLIREESREMMVMLAKRRHEEDERRE